MRAAASFALSAGEATVSRRHLERAKTDVLPAATRATADLDRRCPRGLADVPSHASVRRGLKRFFQTDGTSTTRSVLLVPERRGAGSTAHAAFASRQAARNGAVDAVALATAYDLLRDGDASAGLAAAFDAQVARRGRYSNVAFEKRIEFYSEIFRRILFARRCFPNVSVRHVPVRTESSGRKVRVRTRVPRRPSTSRPSSCSTTSTRV